MFISAVNFLVYMFMLVSYKIIRLPWSFCAAYGRPQAQGDPRSVSLGFVKYFLEFNWSLIGLIELLVGKMSISPKINWLKGPTVAHAKEASTQSFERC